MPQISKLRAILRLHFLDLLISAAQGMIRHVGGILARLRMASEPLCQGANVMRAGATTHPEIFDTHLVRRAPELTDLRASTYERVEPDRKRTRVVTARICQ